MPIRREFSVAYWSYKALSNQEGEVVLYEYWFGDADVALARFSDTSWILAGIFFSQVLTLTSGGFSLARAGRLRIVPIFSSVTVLFLMIQAYLRTSALVRTYQLGYWLAYPSLFLFLCALIFHMYSRRRECTTRTNHPAARAAGKNSGLVGAEPAHLMGV